MNKVNENIRKFRNFRGLSQKQLGQQLSKSANVISNWETGTHSPDLDMIQDICKVLKINPNELFGWEENREYLEFKKRMEQYQMRIEDLQKQKQAIEKEIDSLEKKSKEFSSDD